MGRDSNPLLDPQQLFIKVITLCFARVQTKTSQKSQKQAKHSPNGPADSFIRGVVLWVPSQAFEMAVEKQKEEVHFESPIFGSVFDTVLALAGEAKFDGFLRGCCRRVNNLEVVIAFYVSAAEVENLRDKGFWL